MRAGIRKCILIVQVFTQVHDTDMWNLQISINIRFSTQNYILSSSPHVVFIKELWYQGDLCIYFLKSVLLLTRSVFKLVSFTLVSANFPSKFNFPCNVLQFVSIALRPCQLICGDDSTAYYFGNVKDGTRCSQDSDILDVCIKGKCQVATLINSII